VLFDKEKEVKNVVRNYEVNMKTNQKKKLSGP
jgi:hypothetical protein